MNILAELRSRFQKALASFTDEPDNYLGMIKPAQDPRFGDFQANLAMPLAKAQKANPRELAASIVEALEVSDLCSQTEVAGPGFINLTLRDDWLQTETNRLIVDERLGVVLTKTPRTCVIDYSSPNVAKPMHVGHLRSTVIGAALCGILDFLGNKVVSDNHIGDWGTQFGMIIFGYKHFLDTNAFENNPVGELSRLYQLVNHLSSYHAAVERIPKLKATLVEKQADLAAAQSQPDANEKKHKKKLKRQRSDIENLMAELTEVQTKVEAVTSKTELKAFADAYPQIAEDARGETAKLHAGDEENCRLWNEFLPQCLEALDRVYNRLGVTFDLALGESFYQPLLADVVADLETKSIARESEGATCVFLEENEAPFIIRKKDGAFTYATTDLATIRYRVNELSADLILYVVDARQSEHFKLLFGTIRRWGFGNVECRHVSFGTVLGDDRRPFKTRSGDTVGLESLIDEALTRARAIIDENDDAKPTSELDAEARKEVAEIVGIGGIKYADLRHNRESDYVFNWEKMLAKTGDTATYIQYSYARICGIFRKGGIDRKELRNSGAQIELTQPAERALALELNRFSEALEAAAAEFRPNILTLYLFETANGFSTFYEQCHVLNEQDESIRNSRLLLCDLTARILDKGLSLLGIHICEQM